MYGPRRERRGSSRVWFYSWSAIMALSLAILPLSDAWRAMVFQGKAVATPDEIAWQRTRGMVIMKINKKREAEMQRLAKLESSSRRKKTGLGDKGNDSSGRVAPGPRWSPHRLLLLKQCPDPSSPWYNGVQEGLIAQGWPAERLKVMEMAGIEQYGEAKAMAYLREGLRLRNNTFVVAHGTSAGDLLRYLEKNEVRGAVLVDPPTLVKGASLDWDMIRRHGDFFALVSTPASKQADIHAVQEGLGLGSYLVRVTEGTDEEVAKAVMTLVVKDWQFLESFSLNSIELIEEGGAGEAHGADR